MELYQPQSGRPRVIRPVNGENYNGQPVYQSDGLLGYIERTSKQFKMFDETQFALYRMRSAGQFRRPEVIVKTPSKPTGHQSPKVKQNGSGKNKNGKK